MDSTIIELVTALAGLGAGASAVYLYFVRQITKTVANLTVSEVLEIINDLNQAIAKSSPAGEEITDEEAAVIGRAIWDAIKK